VTGPQEEKLKSWQFTVVGLNLQDWKMQDWQMTDEVA